MKCCVCKCDIHGIGRTSSEKSRKYNREGHKVYMHQEYCWRRYFNAIEFERMAQRRAARRTARTALKHVG